MIMSLRPYFKLDNVRDGLFTVANKLFGITFTPDYRISRVLILMPRLLKLKIADGSHLGVLYMDFYPTGKQTAGCLVQKLSQLSCC